MNLYRLMIVALATNTAYSRPVNDWIK